MEELIIRYCSPVLGDLKTGCLFSCTEKREALENEAYALNKRLSAEGIRIFVIKRRSDFSLVYVCRKKRLLMDMKNAAVRRFLMIIGYRGFSAEELMETLSRRFSQETVFPHEIGLFLSYPLEDVKGFIDNKGKNYKLCGYWKVYGSVRDAARLFWSYRRCTEKYMQLYFDKKISLEELAHAD